MPRSSTEERPSILLVTLDTTRADRLGLESATAETPNLDALAATGLEFSQAYATAPTTLPAHVSMFSGLYPPEHGVHENGRHVGEERSLLAEELERRGYATAAFVSGYPLSREFGLSRGFERFDDEFGELQVERDAAATTDRVLAFLERFAALPLFLWVHYFDPHEPYAPPEPFRSRYPGDPYQGEIAFMDRELGRLLEGFADRVRGSPSRILVAGDHGEGLGDHGEALHGNLLYQEVMRVPLIIAGTGIAGARMEEAVSTRQVFDTVLGWADQEPSPGLMSAASEVVLAEAMKPHLQYGWQPQVMAVKDHVKVIRSGRTEVYDLRSDPRETRNLAGELELDRELESALRAYALPAIVAGDRTELSDEARKKLASLGYFDSGEGQGLREDAPSPRDMTHLFRDLDLGSAMFVREEYAAAIPLFSRVLAADPGNFGVCLRLAVAHSVLGHEAEAEDFFERARGINPESVDLRHYHGMHYFRFGQWQRAASLFESVLAEMPRRLPALERMAQIREREGRIDDARELLRRIVDLKRLPAAELVKLGELSMALTDTAAAIDAFERARDVQGKSFTHALELGVCYLANSQLAEAAASLDAVPKSHPRYPMALFKRAQVAVLRGEPDREEAVRRALLHADETTRVLLEAEPLFRGLVGR